MGRRQSRRPRRTCMEETRLLRRIYGRSPARGGFQVYDRGQAPTLRTSESRAFFSQRVSPCRSVLPPRRRPGGQPPVPPGVFKASLRCPMAEPYLRKPRGAAAFFFGHAARCISVPQAELGRGKRPTHSLEEPKNARTPFSASQRRAGTRRSPKGDTSQPTAPAVGPPPIRSPEPLGGDTLRRAKMCRPRKGSLPQAPGIPTARAVGWYVPPFALALYPAVGARGCRAAGAKNGCIGANRSVSYAV